MLGAKACQIPRTLRQLGAPPVTSHATAGSQRSRLATHTRATPSCYATLTRTTDRHFGWVWEVLFAGRQVRPLLKRVDPVRSATSRGLTSSSSPTIYIHSLPSRVHIFSLPDPPPAHASSGNLSPAFSETIQAFLAWPNVETGRGSLAATPTVIYSLFMHEHMCLCALVWPLRMLTDVANNVALFVVPWTRIIILWIIRT